MKAPEENPEADPKASSREKPRSGPAERKAPEKNRETTNTQAGTNQQPTPPNVPGKPSRTRILPERQQAEAAGFFPLAQVPEAAEPSNPPETLTDLGWMPPAEDQIARFLSDVADIAPPPVREREGATPHFMLPSAISPEEAKRKKAKADPFWSQVVATPMEKAEPAALPRARGTTRKRSRQRKRWPFVVVGIVLLIILGLGAVAYLNPGLLPFK